MDTYLLALYVTLDQELSIRKLFSQEGWTFRRFEAGNDTIRNEVKAVTNETKWLPPCNTNLSGEGQYGASEYDVQQNEPCFSAQDPGHSGATCSSDSEAGTDNEVFTDLAKIMEDTFSAIPDNTVEQSDSKLGSDFVEDLLTETDSRLVVSEQASKEICGGTNETNKDFVSDRGTKRKKAVDQSSDYKKKIKVNGDKAKLDKVSHGDKMVKDVRDKEENGTELDSEGLSDAENHASDCDTGNRRSETQELNDGSKSKRVGNFHCGECDTTFRLLGAFNNHKRDGKCRFKCEFCGKVYTSRNYSNYQVHLKYHTNERAHKCPICSKTYIEAQALKIHMRKHTGDRPYVCDLCGKRFYSASHLQCHKSGSHSEKREIYECELCGTKLSTLGNLRAHKRTVHTVERPFTCEICGKTFKTQKSLEQKHAKVHLEEYPFKCEVTGCEKSFKRSEGLADHMKRHNNQRSHFCQRCGKGFYTNKEVQLHMRTHTGERPFCCSLCGYRCALAGNLRKHLKTHE